MPDLYTETYCPECEDEPFGPRRDCELCHGSGTHEWAHGDRVELIDDYLGRASRRGLCGDCAALEVVAELALEYDGPPVTLEEVRAVGRMDAQHERSVA